MMPVGFVGGRYTQNDSNGNDNFEKENNRWFKKLLLILIAIIVFSILMGLWYDHHRLINKIH